MNIPDQDCKVERPFRIRRYSFAPAMLKKVRECRRNDNHHGALELAEDWIVIAAGAYVSLLAWNHLSWALTAPIYLTSIFLIGGRQRALADILHQAAHG